MTLGRRKGTAGGHNRMCRVNAFNPGQSSSSDGFSGTAFVPGDEMVEWHHRLDGHEFGWTLGVSDGHGGLAYCVSWGRKELDTTDVT